MARKIEMTWRKRNALFSSVHSTANPATSVTCEPHLHLASFLMRHFREFNWMLAKLRFAISPAIERLFNKGIAGNNTLPNSFTCRDSSRIGLSSLVLHSSG